MNTLSKKITPLFFNEDTRHNCYNEVKAHWLKLQANSEQHPLTLAHHILYAILRGKDWRKAFTPISNEVKLANGARAELALTEAQYSLNARLSVFNDFAPLIDPETCAELVRGVTQGRRAGAYNPAAIEDMLRSKVAV